MLKVTPSAKNFLEEVYRASPEIARIALLPQAFFRIVRERQVTALTSWIVNAKHIALTGFASKLERDLCAAKAALALPWRQGHVEGRRTGSSSSNPRCTVVPVSLCYAFAPSPSLTGRSLQTPREGTRELFQKWARTLEVSGPAH